MKKNIIKVLTIAISASMLMQPMTSLAEEFNDPTPVEDENDNTIIDKESSSVDDVEAIQDNELSESKEAVINAIEAVQEIENNDILEDLVDGAEKIDQTIIETEEEEDIISDVETDLQNLINSIDEVNDAEEKVDNLVNIALAAGALLDKIDDEEFENQVEEGNDNVDSFYEAAISAPEKAEEYLSNAEENLQKVQEIFTEKQEAVNTAQTDYNNAVEALEEVQKEVKEAQADLELAKEDSAEAAARLASAKEKAEALSAEVNALAEKTENLEAIQAQYYALMICYFRDALGPKNTVYDGQELDIEANANKITEEKINEKAVKPNTEVMELGRHLMTQLLEYVILDKENVDAETADITIGEKEQGSTSVTARVGEIFEVKENGEIHDKTVTKTDTSVKHDNGYEAFKDPAMTYEMFKTQSALKDGGRTNRFKVTYVDKDGETHTEYYNYIFKSSTFKDEIDIKNGMIYLAQIVPTEDENGNTVWEERRVNDKYSNYSALMEALRIATEAENTKKQYEDAATAVAEAANKVQALADKIAELEVSGKNVNLDVLEKKLADAKEELKEAETKKEELEKRIEEAKQVVIEIPQNKEDITIIPVVEEVKQEEENITEVPLIVEVPQDAETPAQQLPQVQNLPAQVPDAAPAQEVIVEEEDTAKANTITTIPTVEIVEEGPAKAAAPVQQEKDSKFPWWILAIIALITGEETYRRNKKKKDKEKKNK